MKSSSVDLGRARAKRSGASGPHDRERAPDRNCSHDNSADNMKRSGQQLFRSHDARCAAAARAASNRVMSRAATAVPRSVKRQSSATFCQHKTCPALAVVSENRQKVLGPGAQPGSIHRPLAPARDRRQPRHPWLHILRSKDRSLSAQDAIHSAANQWCPTAGNSSAGRTSSDPLRGPFEAAPASKVKSTVALPLGSIFTCWVFSPYLSCHATTV